jgi:hypothetical protein
MERCPFCSSTNLDVGYGLAGGGGPGVYTYCLDCGHILAKVKDHGMDSDPEPPERTSDPEPSVPK